ncbi:MAG: hypothetical protein ACFFCP_00135 [Promethearchaeota archaeon]
MAKRVLLVGMNTFDSGKTNLAKKLISRVSESGQFVEYFKPLSGHNYWYHFEHTKRCMDKGILVSKDAFEVRTNFKSRCPVELSNPIHSLFVPMRIDRPLQTLPNSLGLAGPNSILTMERFSHPEAGRIDTTVLLTEKLLEENRLIIRPEEVGRLTKGAAIYEVENLEAVQEFEKQYFERYVTESFTHVENHSDVVVIESFNDTAWPWDGLISVDSVLVVGPGHVFSYDPEKFRKAAYLMVRGHLPIREVTFGRISDLLRPVNGIEVRQEMNLTDNDLGELGLDYCTGKKD